MSKTAGYGLGLSERFYQYLVSPLLLRYFPQLRHAAARIGLGSEVLGYDTDLSADHDYGPCVQIFLNAEDLLVFGSEIMAVMDRELPPTFEGHLVRYPTVVRPPADGTELGMLGSNHGVELYTLIAWCDRFAEAQILGNLESIDWLAYAEQLLLTITSGAVFRDDIGELSALRQRLSYFPNDVWLYKLAAQWGRVAEDRAYIGRTGSVGDELGSRVIAGRAVGNLMRLALLIERRYAPYSKWFGSAFAGLDSAASLAPILDEALSATNWHDREASLLEATRFLAEIQLAKRIPGAIAPEVKSIHDRPYQFIDSVGIAASIQQAIQDRRLRDMPEFGGADQFIGSQFVLAVPQYSRAVVETLMEFP